MDLVHLDVPLTGAGYFAKVPAKKTLRDFGLANMTRAEKFWYYTMCLCLGAGYFAKIPVAKALPEISLIGQRGS